MALKYLCDLNINDNVLQNMRVFASGTAPTALIGAMFVDTTGGNNILKYHNGSAFISLIPSVGDITAVTAGSGMTGGGTSGDVTLNVIGGNGITANANDVAITPAQTTITSIYNANLIIGRASDDARITFAEDTLTLVCNNDGQCGVTLANQVFKPVTNNDISLGTSSLKFKNAYFTSTVEAAAFTQGGTNINTIYSPIAGSTSIVTVGTIGTGTWAATDIAVAHGGTGSSTAAGAITNLGATTLGGNLFKLANGSAIAFPRLNANNTVSSLSATDFRTAIGAGSSDSEITEVNTPADGGLSGGVTSGAANLKLKNSDNFGSNKVLKWDNGNNRFVDSLITDDGSLVTIGGNLTVNGTTTTIDSTVVSIADNMMEYANANTANSVDQGFYGNATLSGTAFFPAFFYDASASSAQNAPVFTLGNCDAEPGNTATINDLGTLKANLAGNVIGNVTGNVSGSSGSTTGNAATATALATGRTIGMTGDVVWTSASFNGTANVTGTSTIQSGAVEQSMLDALAKGFQGALNGSASGIARTTPTGQTVFTITLATAWAAADGRKCMVEVTEASTYATVYPCVTRSDSTVVVTMNGSVANSAFAIMIRQVA